ncbi:MAG: undecaprenyldiphospho-muramoylpentapeptide beta-N-acetylglucosaminyltransferase [Planctomycetes bacterium]|nr:undecaprenyldiphospho-muramoylpentapeptide beta-N-acetylglucosaminyltransferase [Planctomycetota bacterium]
MSTPKIVLCGGGTGGHIAPALALAQEFSARFGGASVLFLCSGNDLEREMIAGAGFRFEALPIARPGGGIVRKTRSLASMAPSLWAARNVLKKFGVGGAIGVGGYASLPGVMAAKWLRKPVVLLEANAVPGRVTRLLSRVADACYAHLPVTTPLRCPTLVTGNPLRAAFRDAPSKLKARALLGLEAELPTLLVMGGSQGAQALNRAMSDALKPLSHFGGRMQVLHIAGKADYEAAASAWKSSNLLHKCVPFTNEPQVWMAASDLALCRAGAGTISELVALGVPALLSPYPHAADDHQRANARYIAACDAGAVVPDDELGGGRIFRLVEDFVLNDLRRIQMAMACRRLARPNAAVEIADRALRCFGFSGASATADNSNRIAA